MIADLCDQYGAAAVWFFGIDLPGFPPTWEISASQKEKLAGYLKKELGHV
jgi:hypothetical protein